MSIAPTRFRNGHGDNAVLDAFLALADKWIARAADAAGAAWFRDAIDKVVHAGNERALGTAIGLAPRRLGRADLQLTSAEARAPMRCARASTRATGASTSSPASPRWRPATMATRRRSRRGSTPSAPPPRSTS